MFVYGVCLFRCVAENGLPCEYGAGVPFITESKKWGILYV